MSRGSHKMVFFLRWATIFALLVSAAPALGAAAPAGGQSDSAALKAVRAFADCMIQYGRDRYGKVHSPLFSNMLTREKEPRILPYPLFANPGHMSSETGTLFRRFSFKNCLNYPAGLGSEGPHKITLYGCDPHEDHELYETLFDLTRITGDPKYKAAAEEALTWWFSNTQGPSGLYPWGEHLGWDFEYECPTFFEGPCQYLYHANSHEVKDKLFFLDILVRLPAKQAGELTPLEKYAMGIWEMHFWDKEKCYYDRHGDYTGKEQHTGSDMGFPAHLPAYMHCWATAYLNSKNDAFKTKIAGIFNKVLDMAIARTEKYGFFPFTFAPELTGKPPDKNVPPQSLRLAGRARDLSGMLKTALPDVSAKLEKLARLHLGERKKAEEPQKPKPDYIAINDTKSDAHAQAIKQNVEFFLTYGDAEFLAVARKYADAATKLFLDDVCPLPKYSSVLLKTASGGPFPDFYFHGAELMHAFALLGEAERDTKPAANSLRK